MNLLRGVRVDLNAEAGTALVEQKLFIADRQKALRSEGKAEDQEKTKTKRHFLARRALDNKQCLSKSSGTREKLLGREKTLGAQETDVCNDPTPGPRQEPPLIAS